MRESPGLGTQPRRTIHKAIPLIHLRLKQQPPIMPHIARPSHDAPCWHS